MPACDSPCLYCTPHSAVVSLAMQLVIHDEYCLIMPNCLITLVDQCADSEGLPVMDDFLKTDLLFLATRVLYSESKLFREHSRSCCTVLQHLSTSTD